MRLRARGVLAGCVLAGLLAAGVPVAAGTATAATTAAAAPADSVCQGTDLTTTGGVAGRSNPPFEELEMPSAQALIAGADTGPRPRVAVLASGVRTGNIPVVGGVDVSAGGELADPTGTMVAGLVAGKPRDAGEPVGYAPDAEVVDVRVFVDADSDVAAERPSADRLAAGLRWVAQQARPQRIAVAVVPFAVGRSADVRAAVRAVQAAGVVVVAASGDRPAEGADLSSQFDRPAAKDEDAGPLLAPAGLPGVVSVNSTGDPDGAFAHVLKSSRTTVAAPSAGAVSYGLNGAACRVDPTTTGAAAAEVAGVLVLLRQRFPRERPAQLVARLVNTADGTADVPTPLAGAGTVQPYEALTRPLAPNARGRIERTVVESVRQTRAAAPEPEADLLASTKEHAVWWGLVGGGLLVVALLLRPVIARRRE